MGDPRIVGANHMTADELWLARAEALLDEIVGFWGNEEYGRITKTTDAAHQAERTLREHFKTRPSQQKAAT